MKFQSVAACAAFCMALAGCARDFHAIAIQGADQQIRYQQGISTTFSDKKSASIQMTPLGYIQDDNRLIFGIAVFNKGTVPLNFGLDNVSAISGAGELKTYTRDELAHEAKVKAAWRAVAVALAGAAAAYSANQNAYSTTSGYVSGPGGTTRFYARSYDPGAAYAGTAVAGAATGYGLVSIKRSLDETLSHLNGSILQINTVDPGSSAGGEIVVDFPGGKTFPQPITFTVNLNGETHNFLFNVEPVKN